MRQPRVGDPACGCRLQAEMYGMRAPDHGSEKNGGEKYEIGGFVLTNYPPFDTIIPE